MNPGTLSKSRQHGIVVDQYATSWLDDALMRENMPPVTHRRVVKTKTDEYVVVSYDVGVLHSHGHAVRRPYSGHARTFISALRARFERAQLHSELESVRAELLELRAMILTGIHKAGRYSVGLSRGLDEPQSEAPSSEEVRPFLPTIEECFASTFGGERPEISYDGEGEGGTGLIEVDATQCNPTVINARRGEGARFDFFTTLVDAIPREVLDRLDIRFEFPPGE